MNQLLTELDGFDGSYTKQVCVRVCVCVLWKKEEKMQKCVCVGMHVCSFVCKVLLTSLTFFSLFLATKGICDCSNEQTGYY